MNREKPRVETQVESGTKTLAFLGIISVVCLGISFLAVVIFYVQKILYLLK